MYGRIAHFHGGQCPPYLAQRLRGDTERGAMVRSAGITAALKVGATAIAFGASLLYARALGPHGYGLYAYVIAWATLLAIPVGLGIPGYLVREGAKMTASLRWMRRWADQRVFVSGLLVAILMACVWFIPQAAEARDLFVVAALLPLVNVLGSLRSCLLRAKGWVARSQWPNMLAAPALVLAVLGILWAVRGHLYPMELVAAMLGGAVLRLVIGEWNCAAPRPARAFHRRCRSARARRCRSCGWAGCTCSTAAWTSSCWGR